MDLMLRTIYNDAGSPGSFSGVDQLYREAKRRGLRVTRDGVRKWLAGNVTYTLHKPAARKLRRNRVKVFYIDETWQMDLVDVQALGEYNNGAKFVLTAIDVFSKYAFARCLKNKAGGTVLAAVRDIFDTSRRTPTNLQTDAGTEFTQRPLQTYLKSRNINFYTTFSEMKASVVERFNRTLKEKMWGNFTTNNTFKYINVLQDLIEGYNATPHRAIGWERPKDVTEENQLEIWEAHHAQPHRGPPPKFKFKVGDFVRISRSKGAFEKGYTANWSEEYFTVHKRLLRTPVVYRLRDLNGEDLLGVFYERELQKITPPDEHMVEKVIRRRGDRYLVKWRGWPESFNSWVGREAIRKLN